MQIIAIFILICVCFSSCGIYNSNFDCPPGKGVGCVPVGEIMDMIVEKEVGEDLFLVNRGKALPTEQKKESSKEEKLVVVQTETGELILVPENKGDKR